jgi:hypothetical protein
VGPGTEDHRFITGKGRLNVSERTNLFVWQTGPRQWMARHISSGMGSTGESRDEALRLFSETWAERAPLNIVDHAPPLPKRDDVPRESEPAIDADERHRRGYAKYRELLRQVHPDKTKRKFSADEITQALVELWQAVR